MKFRIVMDSAGELTDDLKGKEEYAIVPFTIRLGEEDIIDDGHISTLELVRKIAACPTCAKTACPSPDAFRDAFEAVEADHYYGITISGNLSGSFQAATVGMNMFLEDHPDAKIHIFDSKSTSVKETMIVLMVKELEEQGLPFEEIVEKTEAMIYNADTYFTLDNLETLRKNGRLSKMKGLAATLLKIKPICFGNKDGEIEQIGQARGSNKALLKMVEMIAKNTVDPENKVLGISHTNCHERAVMVRDAILSRIKVKEVVMVETAGLSTSYANDGGIIVVI